MMLFKLSVKNIKKSFKDYAIYFFTLILGVAIFYVFNAIESQTVLLNVTSSTLEIIKLMTEMLSGVSLFVSVILGFLIVYASRFLIKRRNKEFGIYLTLGMSKKTISFILFVETLIIGTISLFVGLLLGFVLSQFMSLLVANLFEADMTNFAFTWSSKAIGKTLIYFGIMYLLVIIFNVIQVGRCKLIDLLYAGKKSERVKMKNPYVCILVFAVSSACLGYAYYLVTAGLSSLQVADQIYVPIALGAVSTFFIFWALSGLILKLVSSLKGLYYKGLNSFTLRQVSSKINTAVFSMTIICLMLFVTICVLSSSLSIKNSMTSNLKDLAPADVMLEKTMNLTDESRYSPSQIEDSRLTVEESLEKLNFDVKKYFKDMVKVNVYTTDTFTYKDSMSVYIEEISKEFPLLNYNAAEKIIKVSDYNRVANLYGNETFTLKDDEYVVIADFDSVIPIRNKVLAKESKINILGTELKPKYLECKDGFIEMSSNHINDGIFIVPDTLDLSSITKKDIMIANYKANDEAGKKEIETKLLDIDKQTYYNDTTLDISTKLLIYEASVGLGALVTFIGLYLGIIFLISSAALLALKELSESTDNKERFRMLRKLGTDEKMINRALFRQIAIFFFFPLAIALVHSVFGLMFCKNILATFGEEQLLKSVGMTALFLIVIYGGYFMITYFCSKNIIKDK